MRARAVKAADGSSPHADRHRRGRAAAEWTVVVALAVLVAIGIRTYAFEAFFVPSASMEPTLEIGDRIFVQKLLFNWHDLHDGDIVVFARPAADTMCVVPGQNDLVKRVIALPGQSVYSSGNNVFVDGRKLSEPYVTEPLGAPVASRRHPFRVPAGELYVMGDNRSDSCDSRSWGPIRGSSVVGRAVLLWWHNGHPDLHLF
ncbi:MAG: signal peptidase I [Acidimicrobiales bacterium]|jgi:signal peptidase I